MLIKEAESVQKKRETSHILQSLFSTIKYNPTLAFYGSARYFMYMKVINQLCWNRPFPFNQKVILGHVGVERATSFYPT